jgi:ubiquinone/menaquinone biosynthesis C-methylase UbiE
MGELSRLDRLRYRAQRGVLLNLLTAPVAVWHRLTAWNLPRPGADAIAALQERLESLLERDLEHADRGLYPRSLLFDFPLTDYLRRFPALLAEPPRATWRRLRRAYDELPGDVDLDALPRYYRRTFHWQTDGWLSARSAALYDLEVESLFGGTADVMRRMALPPLVRALGPLRAPRVLDVACGTGRFLAQLRAALPRSEISGLDLSPHYLARAHSVLGDGRPLSLVAHNAEDLPFRDEHFDAVSCIFLFHELPPRARRRVVREALRVLRPGGSLVVCDSAQLADCPPLRPILETFPRIYHEPYYRSYLRDDLAALLKEAGAEVRSEEPAFLAKVVAAARPG